MTFIGISFPSVLIEEDAMAEATQYMVSNRELVALLVKAQGLHEGLWTLVANFGLGVATIGGPAGSGEFAPTGMVQLLGVGLQRVSEPSPLAVDAAVVNPIG
jgi:hypothetical protein